MNILITGYKGFIGNQLYESLSKYHKVTGIDIKEGVDVCMLKEEHLKDMDAVIHLAASTSVWNENNKEIIHNNIESFIHIYDLCKKLNIKLIYASSSCACNITSLYGLSKYFAEEYAKMYYYDKFVCIRLHNVYGPYPREDTLMGMCIDNDTVMLYNKGKNLRHFTYIGDVLECFEKALYIEGGTYNAYNPQMNSSKELCSEISKYKDLNIILLNSERPMDKKVQFIDENYINLIGGGYKNIRDGIYESMSYMHSEEGKQIHKRMG